jgi:methionyl-tRNA formyltransferase
LTRIQPSGKKMMAAADWARGQAALEGVVFE